MQFKVYMFTYQHTEESLSILFWDVLLWSVAWLKHLRPFKNYLVPWVHLPLLLKDHDVAWLFVSLTLKSVDKILWCCHSNKTSFTELYQVVPWVYCLPWRHTFVFLLCFYISVLCKFSLTGYRAMLPVFAVY